ncbi:hypothetical protein RB200_19655 [Streptomyces sp. PmtG]
MLQIPGWSSGHVRIRDAVTVGMTVADAEQTGLRTRIAQVEELLSIAHQTSNTAEDARAAAEARVAELEQQAAAVQPSADRADLRDRIAEALIAWTYRGKDPEHGGILETVRANAYSRAAAVLAVLPPPADRAAVLNKAAARYEAMLAKANTGQDPRYWTAVRDVTLGLRRMADEAQQGDPDERTAQSGVDTPGCDCDHDGMGYGWHPRDCAWRKSRCTCADAGPEFVPAGHYANCPQADEAQQAGDSR